MKTKIAIVEDDRIIAEDLKRTLLTLGYHVTGCFATGEEALKHAHEKQPDLFLMDIMLRGPLDGIETAEKIHEHAEIPIVYLTAYTDQEILQRAKLTNPYGYLVKPFKTRELQSNIEMALHKNQLDRQLRRLKSILFAIRNVNQLIAKVDNQTELLQRTCEELVIHGGYKAAWIGLTNSEQQLTLARGSGFDKNFDKTITEIIRRKQLPPCVQKVLNQQDELIITNRKQCTDCPLSNSTSVEKMVVVRLEYREQIHGFICVNLPRHLTIKKTELSLIQETAEDIANALNKLYLEKEHNRALQELKENEERFRSLYENTSIGLYRTTPKGEIILANPALVKMLGYRSFEELKARNLNKKGFNPQYSRKRFLQEIEVEGEIQGMESSWERQDGSLIYLRESAKAIRSPEGKTLYYEGTVEDITRQFQSQQALKESENKYRLLVETSPDAVIMTDLEGNITFISLRGLELYGADNVEEVLGQNAFKFIDPKDREEAMVGLETTLAEGELRNLEYTLLRKDGHKYTCSMNVTLVRDAAQNPIAFIATIRDTTEYKRSERERAVLRNLSQRLTEPLSLEQIGKIVAEEAYRLFEYDAFSLDLIDEKQGLLLGIHCEDTPPNKKTPQKVPSDTHPLENLKQDAVIKGIGRLINRDKVPPKSELTPFGYTNRISRSLLFVPIIWKNKTIGTLSVQSYTPNKYQQKDLTLLQALANQGGGALLRAQAQQKLVEAEERYRSTIESMREQIYIINPQGTITDCYLPHTHRGLPYTKENLLDKKITEVFPMEVTKTLKQAMRAIKQGDPLHEFEYSIVKNSKEFWFHSVISGRYVEGKYRGVTVVSRDITKRKQMEKALRESEKKYSNVVDSIDEILFQTDYDGHWTFLNPAWTKITGYSVEESLNQSYLHFIHPDDRELYLQSARQLADRKTDSIHNIGRYLTKDGNIRWCESDAQLILDNKNQIIGSTGVIRDVTDRILTKEKLRAAQEYAQNLIDSSLDMIIAVDQKRKITEFNRAAQQTFGYTAQEVLGKHVNMLYANRQESRQVYNKTLQNGKHVQEVLNKRKDGTIFTSQLSSSVLRDHHGTIIGQMGVFRDITEQKIAANTLQQRAQQLATLNALSSQVSTTFHINKIVDITLKEITKTIAPELAWVFIRRDNGLVKTGYFQKDKLKLKNKTTIQNVSKYLSSIAVKEKSPFYSNNIHDDPRCKQERCKQSGLRAFAALPLISRNKVLGALALASFSEHQFEVLSSFLEAYTGTVAVALDNAQLYRKAKDEIAERKQSETTLKKLQSFNMSIINNMSEGLAVINLEGKMIFINPTAEKMLGYKLGELRGESWKKVVAEDYHQLVVEIDKQREQGISSRYELKLKRKDGEEIDVLVSGSPRFEKKQFQGTTAVFTDISDRKKAEEALKASEYKYRTLVENSILGMAIYTPGQPYTYCNQRLAEITGYSIAELEAPGFRFSDLFSPKDKEIILANTEKRLAGETIPPYILPITTKQGQQKWIEINNVLLKSGQQTTVQMQILDVTERLHAERKLVESEKKYRELFEDSLDAIYVTSKEGQFLDVNKATTKLLDYSKEELLEMKARELAVTERDHRKFISTLITNGTVTNYPLNLRKKDGSQLQCLLSAKVLKDKKGNILEFQGIIHDVTRQVELEEQLRQAIKLEGIGRLAGGIAHDFNNILTGIIGYSDLALASLPSNHPLKDSLEMIVKKADDAASLIRQLLAFSRKQILNIQPVDLNHVILQSSKFLKRVLRDNITLELTLDPNPCILEADQTALQQIITNLCINGQDAIQDQGVIFIETVHVDLDEDFCRTVENAKPGHYVRCTIKDTGSGMSAETLSHIFEPFFTTKDVGEGTGLGLATAYGLVRQQKGIIQCISKEGKGTSFNIFFPAAPAQWQSQMESQETRHLYKGKETILLIEDDVDVLNVMRNILEYSGYTVLIAKDGLAGLDLIKTKNQEIDLLISDLVMPGLSGLELINKMKQLGIEKKVMLITGYATQEIQKELDPEIYLMRKPITSNQLTKKIRELLEGTMASS